MTRRVLVAVLFCSTFAVQLPGGTAGAAPADSFPAVIDLPDGWRPEGIASGRGTHFYVGSIPTGAVYRGDLRTGTGGVLVPPRQGRAAIGMKVDRGLLFVAGGPTGSGYVYDVENGTDVASFRFSTEQQTFVNDVTLTRDAAWFTDSFNPFLYRVARGARGAPLGATAVPLTGDLVYQSGFNLNGIAATEDGATLVTVHSATGRLFTVDPGTGVTRQVDLGGATLPNGDGILLTGRTLYVVQNRLNRVATVELSPDLSAGTVAGHVSNPNFDVPTTIARFGSSLYAVNARFGTPPTPSTTYRVVRLERP